MRKYSHITKAPDGLKTPLGRPVRYIGSAGGQVFWICYNGQPLKYNDQRFFRVWSCQVAGEMDTNHKLGAVTLADVNANLAELDQK